MRQGLQPRAVHQFAPARAVEQQYAPGGEVPRGVDCGPLQLRGACDACEIRRDAAGGGSYTRSYRTGEQFRRTASLVGFGCFPGGRGWGGEGCARLGALA